MAQMQTSLPAAKVYGATFGAALATVAVWLLNTYGGVDVPDPVVAAITTIVTFAVGYMVPPSERDQITPPRP